MPQTTTAVHNEQIKLTATALNNVGVACIVTGVIVPLVSRVSIATAITGRYWGWFMVLWLMAGTILHVTGRNVLKGLRQ